MSSSEISFEDTKYFDEWVKEMSLASCSSFQLDMIYNIFGNWTRKLNVQCLFSYGQEPTKIIFEQQTDGIDWKSIVVPFDLGRIQTYAKSNGFTTSLKRKITDGQMCEKTIITLIVTQQ